MLGRIITAVAGESLARRIGGASAGPLGVVAGLVLPAVARRLGPLGLIAVAAGSWAVSRAMAKPNAPGQGGVTSTSSLPKLPPV